MEQDSPNFVNFCVLHNEVIGHGHEASYLPASQAQEFLSRVLAGPGKVMKYMKARCSGLAAYIILLDPPGARTLISISSPEKMSPSCMLCIVQGSENPYKGRKTTLGGCLFAAVESPSAPFISCVQNGCPCSCIIQAGKSPAGDRAKSEFSGYR